MGAYTAERLPDYFDKWGVRYMLVDGWLKRGRSSGGFDAVMGVQIHHGADSPNTKLETSIRYNTISGPTPPIGNATISRDKDGPLVALYAGLAANTAGVGGPRLTSRGVIPKDGANRVSFAFEAENDGTHEVWTDTMCDLYVAATVAVLDWASNQTPGAPLGAGDVFAHFEWAPGRKIDPRGPSRFNDFADVTLWDMDRFRGEVFAMLMAGPPGAQDNPPPVPVDPIVQSYTVKKGDGWWRISRALGYPIADLQAYNGLDAAHVLHPGDVILAPGAADPAVPPAPPEPVGCTQPAEARLGDVGDGVVELQTLLNADGWYPFAVDGSYGPRTQQAVQKLQRFLADQGFDVGPIDGIYGTQTRTALCAFVGTPV